DELLEAGASFDVSLFELSSRHDIRQLVVKTALTYLELLGVLRQGTPFYAGYRIKLRIPLPELLDHFSGERREYVAAIFRQAQLGRTWYTLDSANAAAALGGDRGRLVRAIDYLGEQGWAEVQASDARLRFIRAETHPDAEALAAELVERFARREEQETRRVRDVVELASGDGCVTTALLAHFGE